MKTSFCFLAMLIGLSAAAQSQNPIVYPAKPAEQDTSRIGMRGIEIYFTQTVTQSNARGLNERLRNSGYPELGQLQLFWGGGVQYRIRRVLLGLEVAHSVNPHGPRTNETSAADRKTLNVQLNANYALYQPNERLRVYPFLAAGANFTTVTLTRTTESADFDAILRQPGNAVSLSHFLNYMNIGVGTDVVSRKVGWSSLASFRLGYRLGGMTNWYSDYTELRNAPLDRLSQFYFQMNVGGSLNRLSRRQRRW
ncbi:hypothetical protein [Persicitalea sp.]|uniref:hypothetical protein n=1 Tax=Persicitalea sp. TaxID=3100273 RepID=UPI003593092D